MQSLLRNSRFYVIVVSILLSVIIALFIQITVSPPQLQTIRIEQTFGLTSLSFLYITLLAEPFCYSFKNFPLKKDYLHIQRALGFSAFYFALLHASFAFFDQLGGFNGLRFLGIDFLIPVILGFSALTLLSIQALGSVEYVKDKLRFIPWKLFYKLLYLAGILIIVHFLMLGTHFNDMRAIIPQITFLALVFLILLETIRIDDFLHKHITLPRFGISTIVGAALLAYIYSVFLNPFTTQSNSTVSFDIHAGHKQLAQLAAQQNQNQQFAVDISKLPGLDGDRNNRYTVGMTTDPVNPLPNQNVTIHFKIFDASSGNPITYFKFVYAKKMHLIIVNNGLTYFAHIHPEQDNDGFSVTTQFPSNDTYHLYIEYQPFGGIEQQMAFTIPIGNLATINTEKTFAADANITTKTFGNYDVKMNTNGVLSAEDMTFGNQKISFTVTDAKTKKPITTLKPYLATFGHLTMINEATYDFIHVHPYNLVVPPPNANGGPTVDFLPIGIYGPFKPGIYRVFAELNPDNNLLTADFTVKID